MTSEQEPNTSILEQASHWWELLHSDSVSSQDHREFGEWVARSPERVAAYLQTARLVQAIKSPGLRWPDTPADVLIRDAKASREAVLPFSITRVPPPVARGGARRLHGFAWGAGAALLASIGLALLIRGAPQEFSTALGEQRSVLLADGSRVTLNTASAIEVNLHDHRRLVRLMKGEALFDVAHDSARPFEVVAGNAVIRDLGTQFNVDMHSNATTVTVVEGEVAVNSVSLKATDRIVITTAGLEPPQHGINVANAVLWTQRQLIFERRPLGEVAEEFNRYNRDRIEIDSAELKGQEVTGVFEAKDPSSFVAFLSSIPGVEITQRADGAHIVKLQSQGAPAEVRHAP